MPTIVLHQPGTFRLESAAMSPAPGPGEVRVRVQRVGVCGTDIHAYHGRQPFFSYPRVLGHELGVEVVELGADVSEMCIRDRANTAQLEDMWVSAALLSELERYPNLERIGALEAMLF